MSSLMEQIWNGTYNTYHQEPTDILPEIQMTEAFIVDKNIFYKSPMRWNKNVKETRVEECWMCGKETHDFYSHRYRTQDGKISNIHCSECHSEYLEKIRIKKLKTKSL